MLLQSLASMVVALECVLRLAPDLLIDTMGCPFTYPVFRLLACARVLAYVHYPIISTVRRTTIDAPRNKYT